MQGGGETNTFGETTRKARKKELRERGTKNRPEIRAERGQRGGCRLILHEDASFKIKNRYEHEGKNGNRRGDAKWI